MWPSRMFRRLHNAVPPHGDQDGELNDDPTSAASTTAAGPRVRLRRGQSSNVRASRSRQRVRQVQASSVQQETISSHSTNHQEHGEAEGDASPDSTIDEVSNRVSQSQPTATVQSGDDFHISRAATSTPAASREPRETGGRVLPASNVDLLKESRHWQKQDNPPQNGQQDWRVRLRCLLQNLHKEWVFAISRVSWKQQDQQVF
jgi:hypothetical protein